MAALSSGRATGEVGGISGPVVERVLYPVGDNVHIYEGALVMVLAGYAYPANGLADSHLATVVGRAQEDADNTLVGHTAGAISVNVLEGAFLWDIGTSGDALTFANVPSKVYAIDDHTVGATYGTPAWQAVVFVGTGVNPGMTVTGTPLAVGTNGTTTVEVEMTLGGAVATATFQYQINGAGEWTTGTTAATVSIGNGLTLNFAAGAYVLGDTYTQSYTGPRPIAGRFLGVDAVTANAKVQTLLV